MNSLHVLIGCAGHQTRWKLKENGYRFSALKQMVPIFGQPMIHRSINQYRKYLKADQITVLGTDKSLITTRASLYVPTQPSPLPDSCIGTCMELLAGDSDHWIMMGDVCWTDEAVAALTQCHDRGIWFAGRSRSVESHRPEIFAIYVPRIHRKQFIEVVHKARKVIETYGSIQRGWLCYRLLHGLDPDDPNIPCGFLDILDETEDFDWPHEYVAWVTRHT